MNPNAATMLLAFKGDPTHLLQALSAVASSLKSLEKMVNQMNAGLNQTAQASARVTQQLSPLQRFTKEVGAGIRSALAPHPNITRLWTTTFNQLRALAERFFNGLRMAAQGLSSIFRALSIAIAAPMIMAMNGLLRGAIGFEEAMVRVSKTTGFSKTSAELRYVSDAIRMLSQQSVSSQVELAAMAEQIGQLGVRAPEAIAGLLQVFEMLAVATDIDAENVAEAFGRIANAFNIDLNTEAGVDSIRRLGAVINRLENDTAATSSQIIASMENFAPMASLMHITAVDAAALSAALISVGISADASGTRLGAMLTMMTQHTEEISQLMSGTMKYTTQADVMNAMNEDVVSVLFDIIAAMGEADNRAQSLADLFGVLGRVGGKAAASLATNTDELVNILAIARTEYEVAISLQNEYNTALQSTQSQLKITRNTWNEMGITLGETILPLINEILPVLRSAFKDLIAKFDALPAPMKKQIILWAALAAVVAPVGFFLSQILFGVGLMAVGLLKMVGVLLTVVKFVTTFIGALLTMSRIGTLAFIGILAGVLGVMKILQSLGVDIASFFEELADKAIAWGENLMATFASGIFRGAVQVISNVLSSVANMIARFLRGQSPPPEGPLSSIDKWGIPVMESYLKGFLNADFSILSRVGGIIKKIFENFRASGAMDKVASVMNFAAARVNLAKLIDLFNRTGQISKTILDQVTKGLGAMSGHVQKLITLWLQYNKIQQQIKDIENQRQMVLKDFEGSVEGIMSSDMSPEEQAEAIRQAMIARNEELGVLDEQEKALQEQSDAMKEQLDWQNNFIDALIETEDILIDIKEAIEDLANAMENISFGGYGDDDDTTLQEMIDQAKEDLEAWGEIAETWDDGRMKWEAFLRGWNGEDPWQPPIGPGGRTQRTGVMDNEDLNDIREWEGYGASFKETWDKITEAMTEASAAMTDFATAVAPISEWLTKDTSFQEGEKQISNWSLALTVLAIPGVLRFLAPIGRLLLIVLRAAKNAGFFSLVLRGIGTVLRDIVPLLTWAAQGIDYLIGISLARLGIWFTRLGGWLGGAGLSVRGFGQMIASRFPTWIASARAALTSLRLPFVVLVQWFKLLPGRIWLALRGIPAGTWRLLGSVGRSIWTFITLIGRGIGSLFMLVVRDLGTWFRYVWSLVSGFFLRFGLRFTVFAQWLRIWAGIIGRSILGGLSAAWAALGGWFSAAWAAVSGWFSGIWATITFYASSIGATIAGIFTWPLWAIGLLIAAIVGGIAIIIWKWQNLVDLWAVTSEAVPIIWQHMWGRVMEWWHGTVVPWFNGIITAVGEFFGNIWNAMIGKTEEFTPTLWQAVWNLLNFGIIDLIKYLFGIQSPSKLMEWFGQAIIIGLIQGLVNMASNLFQMVFKIASGIVMLFLGVLGVASPSKVTEWIGGSIIEGLIIGLYNLAPDLWDSIYDIIVKAMEAFQPLLDFLGSIGVSVSGFFEKISNPFSGGPRQASKYGDGSTGFDFSAWLAGLGLDLPELGDMPGFGGGKSAPKGGGFGTGAGGYGGYGGGGGGGSAAKQITVNVNIDNVWDEADIQLIVDRVKQAMGEALASAGQY